MFDFVKRWRQQQTMLLRLPLIQSELSKVNSIAEEYILLRELWMIKWVTGSVLEKAPISPGMVHRGTLDWSRSQAILLGMECRLYLDINDTPLWKLVKIRLFKIGY